jgi:hypothetical protein
MAAYRIARRFQVRANHPLVPVLLAAAWLAAVYSVSLLAPTTIRNPAMLGTGFAVLTIAFVRLPKPTLIAFALIILFYDSISLWLGAGAIEQMDEVIVPALFVISLWRLKPWRQGVFEALRDGAVLLALGLGVLSSLDNEVPLEIWLLSLLLMAKVLAFLHVVLWHDYTEADMRQFAVAVAAVGVVVLALGAAELLNGPAFRSALNLPTVSNPRGQLPGIKSVFYHPVLFSWFCSFVALFMFAMYTVYRRWPLLLGGLLFSAGSFLSGRRRGIGGLIGALVGGALTDKQEGRTWRAQFRRWLPAAATVLAISLLFLPSLVQLVQLTIDEPRPGPTEPRPTAVAQPSGVASASPGLSPTAAPNVLPTPTPAPSPPSAVTPRPGSPTHPDEVRTQDARLALYLTSIDVARDHFPLGAGLGRYGSPLSRTSYSPIYYEYGLNFVYGLGWEHTTYITDTFWPQILGEAGVLGLLAYALFIGAIGRSLWRATRLLGTPFSYAFALATWMVFVHALIETLASSMFHSPPRVYLLFVCVGMTIAMLRARSSLSERGARLEASP